MRPLPESTLNEWIRTHTPRLLAVASAFADGADEAEDILQEIWIRAAMHAGDVAPHATLAWLYMATMNEGRSRRRTRERRRRLRALWSGELRPATAHHEPPGVGAELQRSWLWRAVAELPSLQREALMLRTVQGLSTRQTAKTLGRAEGTIKASLHRAIATLRRRLGATSGFTEEEP